MSARTLTPDGPASFGGQIEEGPIKLNGALDPNTDVVTGSVKLSPKINLSDIAELKISGEANFSSDRNVDPEYKATIMIEADL